MSFVIIRPIYLSVSVGITAFYYTYFSFPGLISTRGTFIFKYRMTTVINRSNPQMFYVSDPSFVNFISFAAKYLISNCFFAFQRVFFNSL